MHSDALSPDCEVSCEWIGQNGLPTSVCNFGGRLLGAAFRCCGVNGIPICPILGMEHPTNLLCKIDKLFNFKSF
jgi:hypothetical protein